MKRSVWIYELLGFTFTVLGGTMLHFLYEWLGEPMWIAPFSGVNESTFEHMKLMFWPMMIFAVAESFFFKERKDFWCIKLRGILLGLILIPIIFYTYNGVIAKSPDWVNIAIFFISAAVAFAYENRLLNSERAVCEKRKLSISILFIISLLFIIFSFVTPKLEIFRDPISSSYGIDQ